MKLKYYADHYDETDHQKLVSRLKEIQQETALDVDIERINSRHETEYSMFHSVADSDRSTIYDRDFHRNQVLSDNLDTTPSDTYKNSRGTTAFITGLVGVIEDGELLWATPRSGANDEGQDLNYAIDFCHHVLKHGIEAIKDHLDNLAAQNSGPPVERVVRNQFQQADIISGESESEVAVGTSLAITGDEPRGAQNFRKNFATRDIDLVITTPDTHWIIEIKREYTAGKFDSALGQVLVSDSLYQADQDLTEDETQRAVVFGQLQSSLANQSKRRVFGHIVKTAHQHDVKSPDFTSQCPEASYNRIERLHDTIGMIQKFKQGPSTYLIHSQKGVVNGQGVSRMVNNELQAIANHAQQNPAIRDVVANARGVPSGQALQGLTQGNFADRRERLERIVNAIQNDPNVSQGQYSEIIFRTPPNHYCASPLAVQLY